MSHHNSPPKPWRVEVDERDGSCLGIVDARGWEVVQTDSGVYPPSVEAAQMIVDAVNGVEQVRAENRRLRAAIARWARALEVRRVSDEWPALGEVIRQMRKG